MEKNGPVLLNPERRTVRINNVLCGGLVTGTDKVRSGYGNGDCLFLDFKRRIFAVADGSERFPRASRDLLVRFHGRLVQDGKPDSIQDWKVLLDAVYAEQKYHHKTTFTCVALNAGDDCLDLVILHGGDSSVSIIDMVNRETMFQTSVDMNFAGRSREILDVTVHRVRNRNIRIVLATDGMNDILKYFGSMKEKTENEYPFMEKPVEAVCERIHRTLEGRGETLEYDDIGYILLDPFSLENGYNGTVLMGGTRPREEASFQARAAGSISDTWIPESDWIKHENDTDLAGIVVTHE